MSNLNIIATYLFNNPGARYTELTRHLCTVKNTGWGPGNYHYQEGPRYAHRLWEKTTCGGGMLTLEGYGYVKEQA